MPRHGEGSGGGGRATRAQVPRGILISKKLSWVLRHGAQKEKLTLDENGYMNCAELLAWQPLRSLNLTFPELQTLVRANDKQRFQLKQVSTENSSTSFLPSEYLIRASQGHSLKIASDNLLTPILPSDPGFPVEVVHGTFSKTWPVILESGGLRRMGRTHVHFAMGLPEVGRPATVGGETEKVEASTSETLQNSEANAAEGRLAPSPEGASLPAVISGMRRNANVLIWVDVRRSMEEGGLKWWRSANGVVLTEGDEKGFVPLSFLRRVERRSPGRKDEVIWTPGN